MSLKKPTPFFYKSNLGIMYFNKSIVPYHQDHNLFFLFWGFTVNLLPLQDYFAWDINSLAVSSALQIKLI